MILFFMLYLAIKKRMQKTTRSGFDEQLAGFRKDFELINHNKQNL
jgi:hypothetical protein